MNLTARLKYLTLHPWMRRMLWATALVLTVWVLAWALLPGWLKGVLETRAADQLGRRVSIGAVDVRPWSMELSLRDLSVAGSGATGEQLHVREVRLNVSATSLLHLAPVLDAVTVDAPRLRLTREAAGRYDIDDILRRLEAAESTAPGEPARFAVHNITLSQGAIEFQDRPVGRTHALDQLELRVPFLSNLDSKRDITVTPHLSFRLNGAAFDSSAQSLPFASTHKTDVDILLKGLDLGPYLGYLPTSGPVRLQSAVLDARLKLAFEQAAQPVLKLSGDVQVSQLRLVDRKAQELLRFESLKLQLADVRPLTQQAKLARLEWVAPQLALRRSANGRLNLDFNTQDDTTGPSSGGKPSRPWQVEVGEAALREARIDWHDASTTADGGAPAQLALTGMDLQVKSLTWPMDRPIAFDGKAQLNRPGLTSDTKISFSGEGSNSAVQARVGIAGWPLAMARPYLAAWLEPELTGQLDADVYVDWAAAGAAPGKLQLRVPALHVDRMALGQGPQRALTIAKLEVRDAVMDLAQRQATWGHLNVSQPVFAIERDPAGQWTFDRWLRQRPQANPGQQAMSPWHVQGQDLRLSEGRISLQDLSHRRPVRLNVSQWQLQAQGLSNAGTRPATLRTSARIGASTRSDPGAATFNGRLGLAPLSLQGDLTLKRMPLHAVSPYASAMWHADLGRADTSFDGQVRLSEAAAGLSLWLKGDGRVEDTRVHARPTDPHATGFGEELLNWKLLSLRGLQWSSGPGKPAQLDVADTVLSDFFARIVVHANGSINLQRAFAGVPQGSLPSPAQPPDPEQAATPVVNLGPTTLLAGRIHFTDHFVNPNYSADLSELTGRLGAISSTHPTRAGTSAELELRGRAQGTASLDIQGHLNPLSRPPTLDISGKVRDLELPPLSPYAIKYAGHGIERGKLSVDVSYKVLPDGQLTASNQLTLNQLRFGDAVEGAPNSLPVKLAVALLADRNGVIDINLPISGSLNDPQFSLGPMIWKVVVNLIGKALTSPFALLSSAMGGNSETLSTVAFDAGSAVLTPEAHASLDKVAQALLDRPALTLSVVGTASLKQERDAFKRAQLNAMVQGEQRRESIGRVGPTAALPSMGTAIEGESYARLLRTVYRRSDIPKPRNVLGLLKDVSASDMENLLLASIAADEQSMRDLAVKRGVAVKDYLAARQVPLERLFLGAARTLAPEAKWSPRAELLLEVR